MGPISDVSEWGNLTWPPSAVAVRGVEYHVNTPLAVAQRGDKQRKKILNLYVIQKKRQTEKQKKTISN